MELMKEKPITKITIKEICDLSEMSRSTFYLHYQDQFELLADIEEEVLENTEKALGNLGNAFGTPDSIEAYLEYIKENKETFGILLCQPETEDFQKKISGKIEVNVRNSVPEMLDNKNAKYLFTFVMHGSLSGCGVFLHAGVEMIVALLLGDEFVVSALLYDAALLEDYDAVTVADCGKSVSDNKGCSTLHELIHTVLNDFLGSGID